MHISLANENNTLKAKSTSTVHLPMLGSMLESSCAGISEPDGGGLSEARKLVMASSWLLFAVLKIASPNGPH